MQLESLRTLFAIATHLDLEIDIVNIVGVYLNGMLNEEIYMKQLPLYETGKGKVCHLKCTLYGLKQSGCAWNEKLNEMLLELGLKQTHVDQCIYIKHTESSLLILAVHVDDMVIFTSDWQELNAFKVNAYTGNFGSFAVLSNLATSDFPCALPPFKAADVDPSPN